MENAGDNNLLRCLWKTRSLQEKVRRVLSVSHVLDNHVYHAVIIYLTYVAENKVAIFGSARILEIVSAFGNSYLNKF